MANKKNIKKETKIKPQKQTTSSSALSALLYTANGKSSTNLALPKEIFGAKINEQLMIQAVRVYLANQRQGNASTKTRGQVQGSTRKIYRQKGTGRARHGALRAPLFVKGGIAHGPKPKDYNLSLTKKMKKLALFSALSSKLKDKQVLIIEGLEKLEPKTKNMASTFSNLPLLDKKRKVLFVYAKKNEAPQDELIKKAVRNLKGVSTLSADRINTYEVLNNNNILFTKFALTSLTNHFLGKETK